MTKYNCNANDSSYITEQTEYCLCWSLNFVIVFIKNKLEGQKRIILWKVNLSKVGRNIFKIIVCEFQLVKVGTKPWIFQYHKVLGYLKDLVMTDHRMKSIVLIKVNVILYWLAWEIWLVKVLSHEWQIYLNLIDYRICFIFWFASFILSWEFSI